MMASIDEHIQDALRKGHFENLPGTGKPLKLEDDAHVPETLRMANKLLRDNDLVPEWIAQGKELDAERENLLVEARRITQRGVTGGATLDALRVAAKKHNSRVLSYNLKVPQGVAHKRHFDPEQELRKLR
jgi:hypothetical protein